MDIEEVRKRVQEHAALGRTIFSIAGIQALLKELDALRAWQVEQILLIDNLKQIIEGLSQDRDRLKTELKYAEATAADATTRVNETRADNEQLKKKMKDKERKELEDKHKP